MRVSKPGDWISDLFEKGPNAEQLKEYRNIWYRIVVSWIPPRDPRWEYELNFGARDVEAVLNGTQLSPKNRVEKGQHLYFVFPERHMSTQEEYIFLHKLENHPDVMNLGLTIVDMVTKSPLIIGRCLKWDIRIMRSEESSDASTSSGS